MDELVVECANKGAGCEFACQRQLLQAHVKDDCQFAQIPCTEKDCDAMVLRKDLQGHKCGKEKSIDLEEPQERYPQVSKSIWLAISHSRSLVCSDEQKESDYCEACNLSQSATGKLPESQVLCSKCTIGCSQSDNGCQWSGSRYLLEEHLTSCPYEAIKGFFCLNQAQLQEYQVENQLLKLKLSRMEGVVRVLTHEMQALRGIMAPWCHTDVAPGSESLDSDDILSHSPRQFSPFDLSTAVVSPLTREGDGLEIDAYFPRDSASTPANIAFHLQQPPLASQHQRPQHFRPMSMSNLGSPNGPVWDGITNPASATAVTSVAPLDLSTTLEGTLSGLRESVVIMANSMDSMGRKTEIALNNEMRRVNEEIMSLRAGIHGIRMQVIAAHSTQEDL